jgi:hypothetical protein
MSVRETVARMAVTLGLSNPVDDPGEQQMFAVSQRRAITAFPVQLQ